ncbi:aminotransferase class V-fold PLP-dependent enzyme [Acrocarpospora macrocephala]|uniref:Putative aminotransferase YcbU n=1 Tax=Acrocarpospora macrocephala TaxID=150177 RepID=A0A5M3X3X8_9ACTN|nr:aminotransferase class V-fold PLP-dependent enzyme [Acrocarpospora macrocephala]GES12818.1 putative aminotransferase YcbU [Acrocarpospora macrocephala]
MLNARTRGLDSATFRTRFPMLERIVHLASCSLGARSTDLDAALERMLGAMSRQGAPWPEFEGQLNQARQGFAALVRARTDEIAVVPSATVGAYQVASTLAWPDRPKIVTVESEFPSLAHVWLAQRARGAEVTFVPKAGAVADYLAAIDERTGLVSIPMIGYRDAARLAVAEVAQAAHAVGARVFVDAYQAAGVEPLDVGLLECDYLVAGTMKYLLGLPGVAFLYVKAGSTGHSPPQLTGWFGRVDPFAMDPRRVDFPDTARRFETGTPAVPALYAANAGLALIDELDLDAVRRHIAALVAHTDDRLTHSGERLLRPADLSARGAHVAVLDPDPAALTSWLANRQIMVSRRNDVVRLAFHHYNNADDADAACEAIRQYRRTS